MSLQHRDLSDIWYAYFCFFCKIQSKTLWRRELDGLYRLVLRDQLLACSEYSRKHCTYVEIVYQASGSILPTSDSYCFLFLIKPLLIPPAKSLRLFSLNFTTFPGVWQFIINPKTLTVVDVDRVNQAAFKSIQAFKLNMPLFKQFHVLTKIRLKFASISYIQAFTYLHCCYLSTNACSSDKLSCFVWRLYWFETMQEQNVLMNLQVNPCVISNSKL